MLTPTGDSFRVCREPDGLIWEVQQKRACLRRDLVFCLHQANPGESKGDVWLNHDYMTTQGSQRAASIRNHSQAKRKVQNALWSLVLRFLSRRVSESRFLESRGTV
jgi:hypothetical protein